MNIGLSNTSILNPTNNEDLLALRSVSVDKFVKSKTFVLERLRGSREIGDFKDAQREGNADE